MVNDATRQLACFESFHPVRKCKNQTDRCKAIPPEPDQINVVKGNSGTRMD
jgi:hypothetical protein